MHKYSFKIFWSDEDQAFIATCPEFPGLSAFGETAEEALAEARVALDLFIEDMTAAGEPLPAPDAAPVFSGQFRVRLPRTLHRQLSEQAEVEGVSLNALVTSYLAAGIAAARVSAPHKAAPRAEGERPSVAISTHFEQSQVDAYAREIIDSVYRLPSAPEAADANALALVA